MRPNFQFDFYFGKANGKFTLMIHIIQRQENTVKISPISGFLTQRKKSYSPI